MYTHLSTTPIGGKAFLQRLTRLILRYGTYTPPRESRRPIRPDPKRRLAPPGPEEGNKEEEHAAVPGPVPEDILDWWTLEDIRSRGCFVGPVPIQSSQRPDAEDDLQEYAKIFSQSSEAKDATFNLRRKQVSADSGCGTLHVPGWIRERAAEVFFEEGDVDASSVVEVILACLTAVSACSRNPSCCAFLTPFSVAHRFAESDDIVHRGVRRSMHDAGVRTSTAYTAFANHTAKRH
jgi:actin-related protein 10